MGFSSIFNGFGSPGGGGGSGGNCKQGTYYIIVCAKGTPAENAQEVLDAYTEAQSLTPGPDNVISILLSPGEYAFNGLFVLNTPYINLVTISENRDAIFDRSDVVDPVTLSPSVSFAYCLSLECENVVVSGIQGELRASPNWQTLTGLPSASFKLPINIIDGLGGAYTFENCNGGDVGFGTDETFGSAPRLISGTFKNCEGGTLSFAGWGELKGDLFNCNAAAASFGYNGFASGNYYDCTGNDEACFGFNGAADGTFIRCRVNGSFARDSQCSGIFIDCEGSTYSFGGETGAGEASGTFIRCIGADQSFGGDNTVSSGYFKDCVAIDGSFGGNGGTSTGIFINCKAARDSFGGSGGSDASGEFINCIAGQNSFGGGGSTASGTFQDCIGLRDSFGGDVGTASGTFVNCTADIRSFGGRGGQATGGFNFCNASSDSFGGDLGNVNGTFHYCTGGNLSFGGTGAIDGGALYFCRLTTGTFPTPINGGSITLGIDGSNNIINL